MCIRDRPIDGFVAMSKSVMNDLSFFDKLKPRVFSPHPLYDNYGNKINKYLARQQLNIDKDINLILFFGLIRDCLLYTSDAADDLLCVVLGRRRIIKNKKNRQSTH